MTATVETVISSKTHISVKDADPEHDRILIVLDDDTELFFRVETRKWETKLVLDPDENLIVFDELLWPKPYGDVDDDEETADVGFRPSEDQVTEANAEQESWRTKVLSIISEDQLRRLTEFYINVERHHHGFGDSPEIGEPLQLWQGTMLSGGASGSNAFPGRKIMSITAVTV